ncbi:MAG: FecR domain-containing protein [Deltaproteobacteria bacterium]|nr:FecR domain-containing protein [Deltaproteobacteria bacterium]
MAMLLAGLGVAACKKGDEAKQDPPASKETASGPTGKDGAKPASDSSSPAGVSAGGIQRDDKEGPAAIVTSAKGTVEVRRVGETTFSAAKDDSKLYPGDQLRTGDASTATVALADESVIEVAEVSTVAIASRESTADPASGAAVLAGLARFTVTPRAPGEGAFRVYTTAGVVVTRGTVYGVGVAASGEVRVGVESGMVDVFGLSAFDADPVVIEGGSSATFEANGTVGGATMWPADDWGVWRDERDAKLELSAAVTAHSEAMAEIEKSLVNAYADLDAVADSVATFEATASVAADKGDTATYTASLPEGAASIDASFNLGMRLEALTWAYSSRAALATEIYVRHPDVVTSWDVVLPRVDAAVLWPKRYEVTANAYLEPLRLQYYVHHPRGRGHAHLVGVKVPEFYASVEAPEIEPAQVRGRVKTKIWLHPEVRYTASTRPVWVSAPSVNWRANAKLTPAPFRANVGWYVRPPTLKAKVLVGSNVRGKYDSRLKVSAPEPRANFRASWKVPVGMKVKIGAPDFDAGAKARASWKVGAGAGGNVNAPDVRGGAKAKVGAKVDVRVPEVRVNVPDVKAKVDVKIKAQQEAAAEARARAEANAKAAADVKVKIKAPEVKIKAPEVKVKGEAKGGFKIGN